MRGLALGLSVLLVASTGEAKPKKKPKREIRNTTGASFNLIGLQNALDLSWKWSTTESTNPVVSDAHVAAGITEAFTPSFNRVNLWFEYSPLSILDLRVGVEPIAFFGTYSSVIDFDGYDAPYDPLTTVVRADENEPGFGGRLYFEPTFKIKVKDVIFAAYSDLEYWRLFNQDAPAFFYEPARDTIIQTDGDFVMTTSAVLLQEFNYDQGRKIIAGFTYDRLDVFAAPQNQRQHTGVLAVAQLAEEVPFAPSIKRPTLIGRVFYYIKDRPDLDKNDEVGGQVAIRVFLGE